MTLDMLPPVAVHNAVDIRHADAELTGQGAHVPPPWHIASTNLDHLLVVQLDVAAPRALRQGTTPLLVAGLTPPEGVMFDLGRAAVNTGVIQQRPAAASVYAPVFAPIRELQILNSIVATVAVPMVNDILCGKVTA